MPLRNPFARRPVVVTDIVNDHDNASAESHPDFERVDTVGSKASSALSIRSSQSHDNGEYKMSVVNDSGVYLPPSPTDNKAVWPRRYGVSRSSTDTGDTGDIEHFSISRESFDSYRRSFDICARSPILNPDSGTGGRQSLDSGRFPPRMHHHRSVRISHSPPTTEEERFDDIGLDDDAETTHQRLGGGPGPVYSPEIKQHQQPRRRGFLFNRAAAPAEPPAPRDEDDSDAESTHNEQQQQQQQQAPSGTGADGKSQTASALSRFLPGRRRGHSQSGGQGSEMTSMTPATTFSGVEAQEMR